MDAMMQNPLYWGLSEESRRAADAFISFLYERQEKEEDPFYSERNMNRLKQSIAQLNAGDGVEHALVEVD